MIYPDPSLRSFSDLDLMVREKDWPLIHRLLLEAGFQQVEEEELSEHPPKLIPSAVLYEIKYLHPGTGLRVEVHYDDVLNAGLAARDIEGFWRRALQVQIMGVEVHVLSLEDQLIHLCMHLHYHGYHRLSAFSDIAFLIRNHADRLDWLRLLATVKTEEAQVGVYYTLYFLQEFLAVKVPPGVLSRLRPDRFRCWWHDFYLPPEQVLSLQPMYRPDFSFYFLPLLKRLLPDFLVMGRRREKVIYLLRLLLPPPAWLRYYYRLKTPWQLSIYYLLHPLRLFCHYLVEVTTLGRYSLSAKEPG